MKRVRILVSILLLLYLSFLVVPLFLDVGMIDPEMRLQVPSLHHPFGTDTLGRDLLARIFEGGRLSFSLALMTTAICTALSLFLGLISTLSPLVDSLVMKLTDVFKAFPTSLLAILLMVTLGPGMMSLTVALVVANIPQTVRIVRVRAREVEACTFILSKRAIGMGRWEILFRTVLRHVLPSLAVQCAFIFSSSILAESALSFIGAGLGTDSASWGCILSEGKTVVYQAWWMILFPSIFIAFSALCLNLVASSLSED